MYYNEKRKFDKEAIVWKNREYKPNEEFEKEGFSLKNEDFKQIYEIMEYKLQYVAPELKKATGYQEEEYVTKEYGEIELYQWLQHIDPVSAAIIAEIISAPKLNPVIEKIRPDVKKMKTISIDEYRKVKCLGSTKVNQIKELKKKYGMNILRLLCHLHDFININ
jgi:hypothetical protein